MGSWYPITADEAKRRCARPSSACRKSSPRWVGESRFSSTAAFAAAPIFSRRWRLGATAVGIGRPQAWGLAAFGQPGVEAIGDILTRELRIIMRQAGTPDLAVHQQRSSGVAKILGNAEHRSGSCTSRRSCRPALVGQQRGVATAESCTGGWIAKALTDIAGSSQWFIEGFVTYSNDAKVQRLGVSRAVLRRHGAVSEATVRAMAAGALKRTGARWRWR